MLTIPEKINIIAATDHQVAQVFEPHIVGDVNDSQVKVAKVGDAFDWHTHTNEDEAFLVLRGRVAIDFREGSVELGEGEFLVVPRGLEHRPRSLTHEPIILMIEPAGTLNTGDVVTERTVAEPKRLRHQLI